MPVLKYLFTARGQRQFTGGAEHHALHAAAAVAALRILHRLLAHPGLIHTAAQHPVAKEYIVQQRILLGKFGAFTGDNLPRPVHVADLFQHPNHKQIVTDANIHADKAGAAAVVLRQPGVVVLHAVNQLERQPRAGLIQPLQLKLLRPGIVVIERQPHLLHVTRQTAAHRLMDIDGMARPDAGQFFVGHQFVELIALAVGRRGNT